VQMIVEGFQAVSEGKVSRRGDCARAFQAADLKVGVAQADVLLCACLPSCRFEGWSCSCPCAPVHASSKLWI
jgi:hypothetical protein